VTSNGDSVTVLGFPAQLDLAAVHRIVGEDIPYGTWVCDRDGALVYLSDSFLDLVGMTLEECRDSGWSSRLPPDRVERTLTDWRHCVANGSQWDYEHLIRGVDGEYRVVHSRGVPVRGTGGEVVAWVGLNLDVTERKRTEAELASLMSELGRLTVPSGTRPAGDALLAVATSACEAAQAYFGCDRVSLWRRTDRLPLLVARVPPGAAAGYDVDLAALPHLWDELAPLRPVLVGQGGRAPDAAEATCLTRSRVRTQLRLPISIDNTADAFFALDWTQPGALASRTLALAQDFATRAAAVLADAWRRDERRQRALEINDNVIQALVRAKGARELGAGDELDRALDEALEATRHVIGHLLAAEGGTEFAPGQLVRGSRGITAPPAPAESVGQARVLLVDDQPAYRALLRHTLRAERRFVVVGEASDGAEAVSLASSVAADVIVLDLSMPTMDGLEAIRLLRERVPHVKILALSGFAAEHLRAPALKQGADAYLEKGGPIDEIVRTLTDLVAARTR
jgi:PAS domain S-box-containing protein